MQILASAFLAILFLQSGLDKIFDKQSCLWDFTCERLALRKAAKQSARRPLEAAKRLRRLPRDLLPPPREWAERFFNIQRWTELPQGGHFAALEEPEALAADLRAFFHDRRS